MRREKVNYMRKITIFYDFFGEQNKPLSALFAAKTGNRTPTPTRRAPPRQTSLQAHAKSRPIGGFLWRRINFLFCALRPRFAAHAACGALFCTVPSALCGAAKVKTTSKLVVCTDPKRV